MSGSVGVRRRARVLGEVRSCDIPSSNIGVGASVSIFCHPRLSVLIATGMHAATCISGTGMMRFRGASLEVSQCFMLRRSWLCFRNSSQ